MNDNAPWRSRKGGLSAHALIGPQLDMRRFGCTSLGRVSMRTSARESAATSSDRERMKSLKPLQQLLKRRVFEPILGLSDSPHRIALGVALGVFIAFTPTFGLQILLYLAIASAIGANRMSGIGPLFISNPITLVPLYYGAWRLGALVLGESIAALPPPLVQPEGTLTMASIASVGIELWIGSFILGGVAAVPAYFASRCAVERFRQPNRSLTDEGTQDAEAA